MPATIYEDLIELEIDLLESLPLTPESPREWRRSYPFPYLRKTGKRQSVTLRTVVMENSFLRVTILPDLGGRIWSLFDKRFDADVLQASKSLQVTEGGSRGVFLDAGFFPGLGLDRPLNELGPVDYSVDEPGEETDPAEVWLSEIVPGTSLSYHCIYSLPPDAPQLNIRHRTINRSLDLEMYTLGIHCERFPQAWVSNGGVGLFDQERNAGLFLLIDSLFWSGLPADNQVIARHVHRPIDLHPRQVHTVEFALIPLGPLDSVTLATPQAAMSIDASRLKIQTQVQRLKHKLVMLTEDGKTLEAPADLFAERVVELSLSGLPSRAIGLVLMDEHRNEVLRWPEEERASGVSRRLEAQPLPEPYLEALQSLTTGVETPDGFRYASLQQAVKPGSHVGLGILALRRKDFREAAHQFETALLYNAEDHLAWWLKALSERHAGSAEEGAELLNAHYLAPLEPALRAESFLRQEHFGKEKNPLIAPIADNPDSLVEVGCLLLDLGLNEDLFKWVEECLRHREVPMLRYLLASAYLKSSRMEVEASQQVQQASLKPLNPPYPWRPTERRVLEELSARFPSDLRLAELKRLLPGELRDDS